MHFVSPQSSRTSMRMDQDPILLKYRPSLLYTQRSKSKQAAFPVKTRQQCSTVAANKLDLQLDFQTFSNKSNISFWAYSKNKNVLLMLTALNK